MCMRGSRARLTKAANKRIFGAAATGTRGASNLASQYHTANFCSFSRFSAPALEHTKAGKARHCWHYASWVSYSRFHLHPSMTSKFNAFIMVALRGPLEALPQAYLYLFFVHRTRAIGQSSVSGQSVGCLQLSSQTPLLNAATVSGWRYVPSMRSHHMKMCP